MMAMEEKQLAEETSKMDIAEEPKEDDSKKDADRTADQTGTCKKDADQTPTCTSTEDEGREEESKMEVEVSVSQKEESSPKADISMETEQTLSNKEENAKEDELIPKVSQGEPELADDKSKSPEKVPDEEPKEVKKKDPVPDKPEDKEDDLPSTPPDEVKNAPVTTTVALETVALETVALETEWDIPGTDDEKEEAGDKKTSGVWMPDVNVIIDLYQKLDKEGVLELQWKCPGRRLPPEEVNEKIEESEKTEKEVEKPEAEEEKQEEEPTEFDFDIETPSITSMAPRRTPGSGQSTGNRKKPVARMDKIFNDMLRHKRIDEELARVGDESEDVINRTDTTPQRPVGKFRIRKDF